MSTLTVSCSINFPTDLLVNKQSSNVYFLFEILGLFFLIASPHQKSKKIIAFLFKTFFRFLKNNSKLFKYPTTLNIIITISNLKLVLWILLAFIFRSLVLIKPLSFNLILARSNICWELSIPITLYPSFNSSIKCSPVPQPTSNMTGFFLLYSLNIESRKITSSL